MKIFIDAGHNYSGHNTGAAGNNLREQDITFEVAKILSERLKWAGLQTKLSRETLQTNLGKDNAGSINARWQAANAWAADYFISIHVNAGGGTGAETFIADTKRSDTRPGGQVKFAEIVNDEYCQKMGLKNRGVKIDAQTAHKSLGVLRNTKMPAILIELAFIDSSLANPDVEILRNRKSEMAAAIADGLFKFLGMQGISNNANLATNNNAPNANNTLQINILGNIQEIPGYIENDTTWVQMRLFAEKLGFAVGFDGNPYVTTQNGENVYIQGNIVGLPVRQAGGVTWVQMRQFAEKLGFTVGWNGKFATVHKF
ncbi:MAG: N-acetylmuramoyl-L-alanine amidase [Firmicutes bacterium]|nr:N-acetylmuramoyl-L-alanine amidase [Bacillota bacterium]